MFSKRGSIILLAVLLALVVLPGVQAQTFLDDVFGSLFKGFGVAGFYDRNHSIIDFILLAIIFIGLSSMTLGKRFEGRGGQAVSVAVGIALTFAIMVWMTSQKPEPYTLAKFGVIAGIILIGVLAVALFELLKLLGAKGHVAFAFTYILIYTVFKAIDFGVFKWLENNASVILGLLALAYAGAIVIFIWGIIDMIGDFFKELSIKSSHGIPVTSREHHHPERRDLKEDERNLRGAEEEARTARRDEIRADRLTEIYHNLQNIRNRLESEEAGTLQGLERIFSDLAHVDEQLEHAHTIGRGR